MFEAARDAEPDRDRRRRAEVVGGEMIRGVATAFIVEVNNGIWKPVVAAIASKPL
jgi:hypothetical protein